MVTALRTPFYRYGPAQGVGADGVLENGAHLTLLYRSYGYSRVMLESGISGYVSTDAIGPAPVEPKPSPAPFAKVAKSERTATRSRRADAEEPPMPSMGPPLGLPELPADPAPAFRY